MVRKSEFPVDKIFINRRSLRAMSGEKIDKNELMGLFEAARWAPSSRNNQPWRFLYALRGTKNWDLFFNFLTESNKLWIKDAAVLIVLISKKTFDYKEKPSRTHSFDTGAAWENLALQGTKRNLVIHAMQGFDYDEARKELEVPAAYNVEIMIAIGKPGDSKKLPADLMERENNPTDRKKLSEIIIEGKFRS